MADAVAMTVVRQVDRRVRHDRADLRRGQLAEPTSERLGVGDHGVGIDPVPPDGKATLVAIVAEAPGQEASGITAAATAEGAIGRAGMRVASACAGEIAASADA